MAAFGRFSNLFVNHGGTMQRESVSPQLRRLFWVGPVTVLLSAGAVLFIRTLAVLMLHPGPKFLPLTLVPVIFDTTVLVTWAVLVFATVVRFASNPIRMYHRIAAGALLISFLPDIALGRSHLFGASWPFVFALIAMHIAAW